MLVLLISLFSLRAMLFLDLRTHCRGGYVRYSMRSRATAPASSRRTERKHAFGGVARDCFILGLTGVDRSWGNRAHRKNCSLNWDVPVWLRRCRRYNSPLCQGGRAHLRLQKEFARFCRRRGRTVSPTRAKNLLMRTRTCLKRSKPSCTVGWRKTARLL